MIYALIFVTNGLELTKKLFQINYSILCSCIVVSTDLGLSFSKSLLHSECLHLHNRIKYCFSIFKVADILSGSRMCNPEFLMRLASNGFTEWRGQTAFRYFFNTNYCKSMYCIFIFITQLILYKNILDSRF